MKGNPKELVRDNPGKKTNLLFRGILFLLFLILAVAFTVSINYSMITEENFYKNRKANGMEEEYRKNFLVVMYQTSEDFLEKFQKGIKIRAEEEQIRIDFVNVESIDQAVDSINTAVAAKVDGIIAQGIYDADYVQAINMAIEKGITVEFVYTDARGTERAYFVGYNAYDFGKQAARSAIGSLPGTQGNIALMVQSITDEEKDVTGSLTIEGFKSIIDKHPQITLADIVRTSPDLFSAEDMTYDILSRNPDIDAIVCTSEQDTFGVAQVIIDLNRVGDIKLVGTGVSDDILKYIELDVISASFNMNAESMGSACIGIMNEDKATSDYIEIPFSVVKADNVQYYLQ